MGNNKEEKSGVVIKGKKYTWKTILLAFVCLIVLLFIALNFESVAVNLIFAKVHVRLAVLIFMTFGLGFFAGWLVQVLRKKNKQPEVQIVEVPAKEITEKAEEEETEE